VTPRQAALAYCTEHNYPTTVGEETATENASDSSYVVSFLAGWDARDREANRIRDERGGKVLRLR